MASRTLLLRTRPQGLLALSRRIQRHRGVVNSVKRLASSAPKSAAAPILASHAPNEQDHHSVMLPTLMALAAVAVGAAYSHTFNTECEAATATWSSAPSDAAAAAAAAPVRNSKPPTRQHNMMQPRNVMLHRMRSVRGRNLEDKYNVDWSTKLGEGAYGSVYPARLATTGEKVSVSRVMEQFI